jgi:hypothetical protein
MNCCIYRNVRWPCCQRGNLYYLARRLSPVNPLLTLSGNPLFDLRWNAPLPVLVPQHGTFLPSGLELGFDDRRRDHEEAGLVPASGFGRQGNPGRTRGLKTCRLGRNEIEAMKKAHRLRHAADNYFFLRTQTARLTKSNESLLFFGDNFLSVVAFCSERKSLAVVPWTSPPLCDKIISDSQSLLGDAP